MSHLKNFTLYNPTKIIFGQGQIAQLAHLIDPSKKVLMTYGSGSIKKNGVYEQVVKALTNHDFVEYGGIRPNPCYEDLLPIVDMVKQERIDFLLAVGGGSVIDASKFISVAPFLADPWDHITHQKPYPQRLPLGTVLTLPATGSEANGSYVITYQATQSKRGFVNPPVHPTFSILDPTVIASLPRRQLGNGIVDAFTHIMEQYLTYPVNAKVQDAFAESLLRILIDLGPQVVTAPFDYTTASNFMWCTTMALNGLIGAGVPQDWSTHRIGHELTALYGLDHAQTLAMVLPAVLQIQRQDKREKLLQYAEQVWQLSNNLPAEQRIEQAIEKTRTFFEAMGVNTHLIDYGIQEDVSLKVAEKLAQQDFLPLGERANMDYTRIIQLLKQC